MAQTKKIFIVGDYEVRIAMIGQKGIPFISGGVEKHVEEISKRLVDRGHEVTVYCRIYTKREQDTYQGINLKYIKTYENKNLEAIIYTFKASIDIISKHYDIIHYHALGPASLSFIPKLFKNNVVVTVHGLCWRNDKWGKFAKLYLKLGEQASARFPDKVISVSENLRKYYIQKYCKNPNDLKYIPNGVNIGVKKEPNEIKKFGLEEDNYILFLARLVPEKGAHYLIEAYNNLQTDKKLVISGGSSYTDTYVNRLITNAKNTNIVFTGNVSGRLLEELFSNAYMYVLPSDTEGMPITVLEAMSYMKCCLVSNIPENVSIIRNDCGFSFIKSNIHSLTDMMAYLLDNPEVVKNTGIRAHEEVKKKYNWDCVVDKTESLYLDILKNN